MSPLKFHALIWKEDRLFVAKCLEIEVTSQGKTKTEALTNLKEALGLYFENENAEKLPQTLSLKEPKLETFCYS